jgi:KTSC domain-containing protein
MKTLLEKVKSSNIEAIGHDVKKKMLYIMFLSGGLYSYSPFDEVEFTRFKKAKSKGKWFHKHVKDNDKYTVQKVSL